MGKSGRVMVGVVVRVELSNVVMLSVVTEVSDVGYKNKKYHRVGDRMAHKRSYNY